MGDLRVEMHGRLLGHLVQQRGSFDFVAALDAVREHGLGSLLMSRAVPLVPYAAARDSATRRNFFAELLPEGEARQRLADQARVSSDDTVGMLRAYGRDVAGALQIWDPDDPTEPRIPTTEPLDENGVARMLRDVAAAPLGNRDTRGKTSLNGVQNKIVLVRTDAGWARALDGFPSTHIVKPIVPRYPTMIFDEEYGSRFARQLGLASFDTRLESFDGVPALVIERYDRDATSVDGRIHQEDFNQVLGLAGNHKYETYGGRGLADVAKNLNRDDRRRLLRMTALSVALGNLDMHAKNVALLHHHDGAMNLAPMYDVVPQAHEENDGEIAFRVGGEFAHRLISRGHLAREGESWGVSDADELVGEVLQQVATIASEEKPHPAAHPGLQWDVLRFTENLLAERVAGDSGDGSFVAAPPTSTPPGGWTWNNSGRVPRMETRDPTGDSAQ